MEPSTSGDARPCRLPLEFGDDLLERRARGRDAANTVQGAPATRAAAQRAAVTVTASCSDYRDAQTSWQIP